MELAKTNCTLIWQISFCPLFGMRKMLSQVQHLTSRNVLVGWKECGRRVGFLTFGKCSLGYLAYMETKEEADFESGAMSQQKFQLFFWLRILYYCGQILNVGIKFAFPEFVDQDCSQKFEGVMIFVIISLLYMGRSPWSQIDMILISCTKRWEKRKEKRYILLTEKEDA